MFDINETRSSSLVLHWFRFMPIRRRKVSIYSLNLATLLTMYFCCDYCWNEHNCQGYQRTRTGRFAKKTCDAISYEGIADRMSHISYYEVSRGNVTSNIWTFVFCVMSNINIASMHHGTHARAVMHVGIVNLRWRGKRSRHSRRIRNSQFYVSAKRPMAGLA